jgi:hypothetical protein
MLPVVSPLPLEVCMSKPPVPMALLVWSFPRSKTIWMAVLWEVMNQPLVTPS